MNSIAEKTNNDIMGNYHKTDNIIFDMQKIIDCSQQKALQAVNAALVQRNWLIGR